MIGHRRRQPLLSATALLLVLLAGGCGGSGGAPPAQVAARVNKDEITVHQVQLVLQRQPRLATEFPERAARTALDSLIEQELAAQAAREQGIDREPSVVQAMAAARREILAREFQDRVASKATGPSSDDIDRYYDGHPGLFAKRRVYTLQEFRVATADGAQVARVQAIANDAKSAAELEERLAQSGLRYRSRVAAQAPEDLPLGIVAAMSTMETGRSLVVPQGDTTRVLSVLHVQAAPIDRRMANEAIASFLLSERKRRAVAEGMKSVRDAARIEYGGAFAQAASAPASAAGR